MVCEMVQVMARRDPTAPTKAEAAATTRADLLEAGFQLLQEQPVGTILTQVKATEIARRAGRTIGAFYHHWPDQQAYQRDLIEHVLSPDRLLSTAVAEESVRSNLAAGLPMEEIIRRGARANFETVRDDPTVPLFMALWSKQATDDHIRKQLRQHYQQVTDQLVPVYAAFFDAQGWEPRPPFTLETFASTLTALVEGLTVRAAVDPDAVPFDLPPVQAAARMPLDGQLDQGSWDLFSTVVLALIPSMTVPKQKRDPDVWLDHEDVRGLVRRLRETWEVFTENETNRNSQTASRPAKNTPTPR